MRATASDEERMLYEGQKSIWRIGEARLLHEEDRDTAWAERTIQYNPSLKWVLGKYVESDRANSNMQKWSLANLQQSKNTIKNTPLNLLHNARRVVGHFADCELLYPTGDVADDANPYVEALAAFYGYYFPEELEVVSRAHKEGSLFFSMEQVAETVSCDGCGAEFAYKGPQDPSYCDHINNREAARSFGNTTFLGGALIIPPVAPGWKNASVTDISELIRDVEYETAYEELKEEMPDQNAQTWHALMEQVVMLANMESAKTLDTKARKSLSKDQFAIPEKAPGSGSYPIPDLNHARDALARSAGKPEEGRVRSAVYKKFPALKK